MSQIRWDELSEARQLARLGKSLVSESSHISAPRRLRLLMSRRLRFPLSLAHFIETNSKLDPRRPKSNPTPGTGRCPIFDLKPKAPRKVIFPAWQRGGSCK